MNRNLLKPFLDSVVPILGAVAVFSRILTTIEKDERLLDAQIQMFIEIIEALIYFYPQLRRDFYSQPVLHSLTCGLWRQRFEGNHSELHVDIKLWATIQRTVRKVSDSVSNFE